MAKHLHFDKPNNLTALHAELLAAIPALRPVPGTDGLPEAVIVLTGAGTAIDLFVPDNADETAISAVVAAHTNPPPPDTTEPDFGTDAADLTNYPAIRTAVTNLRAYVGLASPTAAQSTAALQLLIKVVLAILRRMV